MVEVLLFHHARGQTPGFHEFAEELRGAGHTVHTPDLVEGRTFESIEAGVAYAEEVGFDSVIERGVAAAQSLPAELVYIGFSLGVLPAQALAQTRPGARGAVLVYSCVPHREFSEEWPRGVPVQIHGAEFDPIFTEEGDLDAARDLVDATDDATLFLYPESEHYFADSSLESYRPASAALLTSRVLDFLAEL